jgi:hypothetical protein
MLLNNQTSCNFFVVAIPIHSLTICFANALLNICLNTSNIYTASCGNVIATAKKPIILNDM